MFLGWFFQMYTEWGAALEEAAQDKSVTLAVITGNIY